MINILRSVLYKYGYEHNPHAKHRKLYKKLFNKYQKYTMVPEYYFHQNLALCMQYKNVSGDIVECGVWKGGMSAAIADSLNSNKHFHLFDSFEGLPAASEKDGKMAIDWQQNEHGSTFYNNCSAEEKHAIDVMSYSKAKNNFTTVKGWFNETLPNYPFKNGISILRLDGDWYDSSMTCLDSLFHQVNPGGLIIIDDYNTWEGCSKAVHDFLSKNQSKDKILTFRDTVHYIQKK